MTNGRALARGVDCASPESLADPLNRSPEGDQYSLYYCLAGQFPFPMGNPVKKMLAHQCEEPTPVEELAPTTPKRRRALVRRLMAKALEDRFDRTADVVEQLQAMTAQDRWAAPKARRGQAARPPSEIDPEAVASEGEEGHAGRSVPWWVVAGTSAVAGLGLLIWLRTRG